MEIRPDSPNFKSLNNPGGVLPDKTAATEKEIPINIEDGVKTQGFKDTPITCYMPVMSSGQELKELAINHQPTITCYMPVMSSEKELQELASKDRPPVTCYMPARGGAQSNPSQEGLFAKQAENRMKLFEANSKQEFFKPGNEA